MFITISKLYQFIPKSSGLLTNLTRQSKRNFCRSSVLQQNTEPTVIDVDMDNMPADDESSTEYINDNGIVMSPIDIDPWADEERAKQGTVDMENVENLQKDFVYPDPPANRSGIYEFEGLKIWLPKPMLSNATYRYRDDEDDQGLIPDDTRVCRYDK